MELERKASRAMEAASNYPKAQSLRQSDRCSQNIFSTTRLRKFLDAELSAAHNTNNFADADESGDFTYLPEKIQEWIAGQQHILFEGQVVSTFPELTPFYKRYCSSSDSNLPAADISPTDMILKLMKVQFKVLNILTQGKSSIVDKWSFYGFGRSSIMKVKCNLCKESLVDDENARWSIVDPAIYITRRATKYTCEPGSRFQAVPQDKNINFIQGNQDQLKKSRRQKPEVEWERLLRKDEEIVGLSSKVESWCIECKDKTTISKLSGSGSVFVDEKPRWTVGVPAKYIERRLNCLTCHKGSNRFVPVDENVGSIAKAELVTFAKEFGDSLTDAELAVALQRRHPARRDKRIQTRP
jgi:hypothetical protein